VPLGVPQAGRGDAIDVRCVDEAAVAAQRSEADVVERITSTLGAPVGGRSGTIGGNFVSGSLAS